MRSSCLLPVLAGLAIAAPAPQLIDLAAIDAAPDPVFTAAPLDVQSQIPKTTSAPQKRDLGLTKRDGDCALQPAGSGPVPSPDTPAAFSADPDVAAFATNAPTPDGYTSVFTNLNGSLSAAMYMGLYTLKSYDVLGCASKCDQASGCVAFNMYLERDPSVDPNAANCPNPASTTNFKCTLWGAYVAASQATNYGQYRDDFQVVIGGSNGYNKNSPPPAVCGYSPPVELGGAINAPLDSNGKNTYLGYKFYPYSPTQGYSAQQCAAACASQTAYNSRHPAKDGTYAKCSFFNVYVLSENAVPQGLYCSLYSQTWDRSYGTNYGQYRGSDRYTVSQSYSYSLDTTQTCPDAPDACPTDSYISNGNFDNGDPPTNWTISEVTGPVTYEITHPGTDLAKNGGNNAFTIHLNPSKDSTSPTSLTLSQPFNVCAGKNYSVTVDYKFSTSSQNACSFAIKYPYNTHTNGSVTAPDSVPGYPTGHWTQSAGHFQGNTDPSFTVFYMVFTCQAGASNDISVDDVIVFEADYPVYGI